MRDVPPTSDISPSGLDGGHSDVLGSTTGGESSSNSSSSNSSGSGYVSREGKYRSLHLQFSLPPGCYATMMLRELTKESTQAQVRRTIHTYIHASCK